ncbi:MAG: hypothetical protein OM95_09515 [Bdellovibrio sp. ArHS]|nr:MAG: hypothetical protein OM95_09515 [Bdellovibrio sp. ArHS]
MYFSLDSFKNRPALFEFGLALNFILLLSAFFWKNDVPFILQQKLSICWPFFASCYVLRPFSEVLSSGFLWAMVACAIFSSFYLLKGNQKAHFVWLFAGYFFKALLFVQDYRLMGNYHWMPFWCVLIYLFARNKESLLKVIIVLFYFFAGVLKLSKEWISGSAMLMAPLNHVVPIEVLTVFVIVLELLLIWFLFSKRFHSAILILLFFFHLYSWHQVGYFYPLVMFFLLTIFVFGQKYGSAIWHDLRQEKAGAILLGIFVGLQFPGYLIRGDEALTGEGRYFSLNMIDAHSQCQGYLFYQQKQQWTELALNDRSGTFRTIRIHCEPLVYWQFAKSKCRELKSGGFDGEAHLYLFAKRSSDQQWTSLIQEKNVCASRKESHALKPHDFVNIQESETFAEGVAPVVHVNDSLSPEVKGSLSEHFLGGPERNNVFSASVGAVLQTKKLIQFNSGVHTAAKSTPVADETGFYVASDSGRLTKFDWDGNILWNFIFQNTPLGIHSTPLLWDKAIFLGTYSGDFYKIDKMTGDLIWVRKLGDAIGASPLLSQNMLVINTEFNSLKRWGGMLVALDPQSGSLIWRSDLFPDQSHSSPSVLGQNLYFGSNDGKIRVVDLDNGKTKAEYSVHEEPIKSSVLVADHSLYFSDWKRGLGKMDLNGKILWQLEDGGQNMSTPLWDPQGKHVFYGNSQGLLKKVNPSDGNVVQEWKTGERSIKSGLLQLGKDLFFGCGEDELCQLNTDNDQIHKIKLDGRVTATPIFYDGKLVVVTDAPGSLWLIRFDRGKKGLKN